MYTYIYTYMYTYLYIYNINTDVYIKFLVSGFGCRVSESKVGVSGARPAARSCCCRRYSLLLYCWRSATSIS